MQTVIVNTAPDTPSLYARTLAGLFKRSRNAQLPALRLVRPAAVLDPAMLARYASVCGFHPEHGVPLTAPHLLAFPLHMLLLTDPSFPWPALGLVHLANQIHQHQPLASGDALRLEVECGALVQHAKGQAFVVHARAYRRGAAVWDSESLYLRRGAEASGAAPPAPLRLARETLTPSAHWSLPARLGRDYAKVSGDYNPIHLGALPARAFGFPRAIAHGMWTLAYALAALQPPGPLAQASLRAEFKLPLMLPAEALLWSAATTDFEREFEVRDTTDKPHLRGHLHALPT